MARLDFHTRRSFARNLEIAKLRLLRPLGQIEKHGGLERASLAGAAGFSLYRRKREFVLCTLAMSLTSDLEKEAIQALVGV